MAANGWSTVRFAIDCAERLAGEAASVRRRGLPLRRGGRPSYVPAVEDRCARD